MNWIIPISRKVSRPVTSWKYGLTSLIALFHDILIPLGVFSLLGKFYNAEITIPIVAALLTILGFSVHDTIIIFDDIHWSGEMEAAWKQIKKHPQVTCTIDLFFIGVVLLRKEFKERQHFMIRY